jgi:hypothetical protein
MLTEIDIAPFAVSDMWAATVDGVVQTDSISASQAAAELWLVRYLPSLGDRWDRGVHLAIVKLLGTFEPWTQGAVK